MRGARPNSRSPPPVSGAAAAASAAPPVPPEDAPELAQTIAQQLAGLSYECALCLEVIRHQVAVWPCGSCFRVFHLYCIKKWAAQSDGGSFRCPHCQTPQTATKTPKYRCFCGKCLDPAYDPGITPHSCGQPCGRRRGAPDAPEPCPHPCPALCHPGPCPDCSAAAPPKPCPCGKTTTARRCGKPDPMVTCGNPCGKPLACGTHRCEQPCHFGPCPPCAATAPVLCSCGKAARELPCGSKPFDCGEPCGKTQRCGTHKCPVTCHAGACPPCDTDPAIVTTCPCGKTPLAGPPRAVCTDPVPTCGAVCGRALLCGRHTCAAPCHPGECEPCNSKVQLHCPCGSTTGKVYCRTADAFRCSRKCKAKMSCGKHECEVICCKARTAAPGDAEHVCMRVCNKKLPCGHACAERCHRGSCPPCVHIITHPLHCRCGFEMLMPPQPCSTPPPTCERPCGIEPACGHPAPPHNCHFGECPPCAHPVARACAGGHTTVSNVLCSAPFVLCSAACGKILACGHPCPRRCHAGECGPADVRKSCGQPCGKVLPDCGHRCLHKCHDGGPAAGAAAPRCPKCIAVVELRCECGILSQKLSCAQFAQRLAKHEETHGVGAPLVLACSDECLYQARLAALASIGGPKPPQPRIKTIYSLKLWEMAKRQHDVVVEIEQLLAAFIASPDPSVTLKPMPKEKRVIVHELCLPYHLHCEALDEEPRRACFLTKSLQAKIPTPLLSVAVTDDANDPGAFAQRVFDNAEETVKRVIVFEGERLNEISVNHFLRQLAGQFVTVSAEDDCAEDDSVTGPRIFYAVFTSAGAMQQGYTLLRKTGCPVTFRQWGAAPPPRRFQWEPARREVVAAAAAATAAAATAVAPAPAGAPWRRRADPEGGWASLIQSRADNAKARKQRESEALDAPENMFSALKRR